MVFVGCCGFVGEKSSLPLTHTIETWTTQLKFSVFIGTKASLPPEKFGGGGGGGGGGGRRSWCPGGLLLGDS